MICVERCSFTSQYRKEWLVIRCMFTGTTVVLMIFDAATTLFISFSNLNSLLFGNIIIFHASNIQ
jgi:hypothetical protein